MTAMILHEDATYARLAAEGHPDLPHPSGDDRYAIYAVIPALSRSGARADRSRRRLCETSRDGIGTALVTMRDDGEIGDDTRVGIFDRLERTWIVNPWAKGTL